MLRCMEIGYFLPGVSNDAFARKIWSNSNAENRKKDVTHVTSEI